MAIERKATDMALLRRREFLETAVASASLLGFGTALAQSGPPASEQIRVGVIGTGTRGRQLIDQVPSPGKVVAICDVDLSRAEKTKERRGTSWPVYQDYREMLDKEQMDAVIVATPDHTRVLISIHAMQAGLDVYAEKPLSLYIAEGRTLVKAARHYNKIVQVGSQQRTMEMNGFACRLVRDGGIGTIRAVHGMRYKGPMIYKGLPKEPIPDYLNWELWQAQAPARPYNDKLRHVWDYRAYTGGEVCNWGAHGMDQIQWALGKSLTGPTEVWPTSLGPDAAVAMRYADGVQVHYDLDRGPRGGGVFTGTEAKIEINRNKFVTNPEDFIADPPEPAVAEKWEGKGWIARPHVQNWLDCIKTRELPNADVEIGHRSVSICHLVNITRELNRKLRWDPDREEFVGDAEANELLVRDRRAGYELPKIG
jgi:predicted dehydrogenase